jgi:hypothetical protein
MEIDTGTNTPTVVAVLTPLLALVGAAVGAVVLFWNNTRNVKVENITKERAKWRDNVRQKALNVHKAAIGQNSVWLDELHLEFTLILNPSDPDDRAILNAIRLLKSTADGPPLTEFADRIALLLKHDWERAKWEAEGESIFSGDIDLKPKPARKTYEQFKRDQSTA